MVLTDPGGHPVDGVDNWSNGWLPSLYQGTVVRPQRAAHPQPRSAAAPARAQPQDSNLDCLGRAESRSTWPTIPARPTWKPASPATNWPRGCRRPPRRRSTCRARREATHKLYGLDDPATAEYGTRCLIARRLVERGVRFVQISSAASRGTTTTDIRTRPAGDLPAHRPAQRGAGQGPEAARPAGHDARALGRRDRPAAGHPEGEGDKRGRDHNSHGFSMWLAGGGIKGGTFTARPTSSATRGRGRRAPQRLPGHAAAPVRPGSQEADLQATTPATKRSSTAKRPRGDERDTGLTWQGTAFTVSNRLGDPVEGLQHLPDSTQVIVFDCPSVNLL